MIEKIDGIPAHVAVFKPTGKVTKDDYEYVIIPTIEKILENTDTFIFCWY